MDKGILNMEKRLQDNMDKGVLTMEKRIEEMEERMQDQFDSLRATIMEALRDQKS